MLEQVLSWKPGSSIWWPFLICWCPKLVRPHVPAAKLARGDQVCTLQLPVIWSMVMLNKVWQRTAFMLFSVGPTDTELDMWTPLFLRRRLGLQASQYPGRPGRLANPRLILFSLYFPPFSLIFTDMASPCLALYSPRQRLGGWKRVDRLASPHLVALRT
jgi:hypothetical protein